MGQPKGGAAVCAPAPAGGLLLVAFDDLRPVHLCLVCVMPRLSQGGVLTGVIPTLVQFDLYADLLMATIISKRLPKTHSSSSDIVFRVGR